MKAVIFDLGGVVVEWDPAKISQDFAKNERESEQILNNLVSHPDWTHFDAGLLSEGELAQRFQQRSGIKLERIYETFQFIKESLTLIPQTAELMKELQKRDITLFCISNMSHAHYDFLSKKYDFFECFESKIISAETQITKPDPRLYEIAIEKFNIDPQHTLFIDDREDNIKTAKAFGFQTLHFKNSPECLNSIDNFYR